MRQPCIYLKCVAQTEYFAQRHYEFVQKGVRRQARAKRKTFRVVAGDDDFFYRKTETRQNFFYAPLAPDRPMVGGTFF
jgi:hypothetical protein